MTIEPHRYAALGAEPIRTTGRDEWRYSGGLLDWEDAGLPLEGAFVSGSP